jgi:hypothetical protein
LPSPLGIKENAPAIQVGFHLGCHSPEIDWNAVDNGICLQDLLVNLKHIILNGADSCFITFSAIQASGDLFLGQHDLLHFTPCISRSSQGLIQKDIAVPSRSGAPQNS